MMASQRLESAAEDFRRFILDVCGSAPDTIIADGKWHSFRMLDTRHKGSRPGRYLLHNDQRPVGWFMDWRDEKVRHRWLGQGSSETLDRAEIADRRAARRMEQVRAFQIAAEEAVEFWQHCPKLSDGLHPYLKSKGVMGHGTRQGSGKRFGLGDVPCVIVPLSDSEGKPQSLQAIREDGERRFWPGTTHEGACFIIGKDTGVDPIVFCEGYSTAASIHEATDAPVVMCITSGNMPAVARWAGHRWHGRGLIVAGDDDWHLLDHPKLKRNVGKDAAVSMAKAIGGRLIMPDMSGLVTDGGDDFNDMAREFGPSSIKEAFATATASPPQTALPLVWYDDNQPLLSGNWIIKNVVPAEAFATIIGHPGCGKSFLALDMGLHVSAGMAWQGRKVRRGLVIYLAAEGQRGQQNRVEAWRRHHRVNNLPFAMIPAAVNLRDREEDLPKLYATIDSALARAREQYGDLPLAMLVVDTLNRTFGGGDENGTDMSDYVASASQIKDHYACTVVVVHHIPKNSETVSERGHGSLRGAIETSLVISADQETGVRTVLCKKQKDAEDGWKTNFNLGVVELGHDEDGDVVTSCFVNAVEDAPESHPQPKGPRLSSTQRQALNELMATLEAHPIGLPSDFPIEMRGNMLQGRVASRKEWQTRWTAIAAGDKSATSASATFRRSVTDLQNLGLVGAWNDFVWVVNT